MTGLDFAAKKGMSNMDQFVIQKKYPGVDKTEEEWFEILKDSHTIPVSSKIEKPKEEEVSSPSDSDSKSKSNTKNK